MKILVIGCHRTKSSALVQYLVKQYPNCTDLYEYYTTLFEKDLDLFREYDFSSRDALFISNLLKNKTRSILEHQDCIVKLLGNHLPINFPKQLLSTLALEQYNQINLIERYDFYSSCASLEICMSENVWHLFDLNNDIPKNGSQYLPYYILKSEKQIKEKYNQIRNKQYLINFQTVKRQAIDVANYLTIKSYLIEHKVPYHLYNYSDKILDAEDIFIKKNNIDYTSTIANKEIQTSLNNLFNKFFDYKTCHYDLTSFLIELKELVPQKGFEPPTY